MAKGRFSRFTIRYTLNPETGIKEPVMDDAGQPVKNGALIHVFPTAETAEWSRGTLCYTVINKTILAAAAELDKDDPTTGWFDLPDGYTLEAIPGALAQDGTQKYALTYK